MKWTRTRYDIFALVAIIALVAFVGGAVVEHKAMMAQEANTTLTLADTAINEDAIVAVDLVADSFPSGLSGFSITVATIDPAVARAVVFVGPDYGLTRIDQMGDGLRFSASDLNHLVEPGAAVVTLATVSFLGAAPGVTTPSITVERIDDEDGFPITTSAIVGTLTVAATRDLDGDGITEDINGNGRFDFADIVGLFEMLIPPPP